MGSKELITELKKMWSPYSVNVLGLSIIAKMLPDHDWVTMVGQTVEDQRQRLQKELADRKITTRFGGGNFFLPRRDERETGRLSPSAFFAFG